MTTNAPQEPINVKDFTLSVLICPVVTIAPVRKDTKATIAEDATVRI